MTNSRPVHLLLATVAIAASATTATAAPALLALAAPACPQVHVFGARETTLPPGFGSSQTLVDLLLRAFPGSTAEAIDYPAAGDDAYASSVTAGVAAVVRQATRFADACPETILIMHGYSQVRTFFRPRCLPKLASPLGTNSHSLPQTSCIHRACCCVATSLCWLWAEKTN
ncbi:hypothetical protein VTK73DRAFT_7111 [Phialemonium thermophilum]|uniref:Cutinase n=1 Tax=Phialemonium thermophilum TaxID=223376 RepID=A0ABR3WGR8_9PEZI